MLNKSAIRGSASYESRKLFLSDAAVHSETSFNASQINEDKREHNVIRNITGKCPSSHFHEAGSFSTDNRQSRKRRQKFINYFSYRANQ